MNKYLSLFLIVILIGFVQAVDISQNNGENGFGVYIEPSDPPTDFSIQNVNSSEYWDNLDTPADINTGDLTDDNTYVEITGDTMTGNLSMDSNNAITFRDVASYIFSPSASTLNIITTTLRISGTLIYFGEGDDVNIATVWDTSTFDGNIAFIGANDYFQFSDDIYLPALEYLFFGSGRANNITALDSNNLKIDSPNLTVSSPTTFTDEIRLSKETLNITQNVTCVEIYGTTSILRVC